jgi:hypothetical protein
MGDIREALTGEALADSFLESADSMALMYWCVCCSSCDCCLAALISA